MISTCILHRDEAAKRVRTCCGNLPKKEYLLSKIENNMKTKFIMAVPVLCFLLMAVQPYPLNSLELYDAAQDSKIIGVYDGNEGYGYNFTTVRKEDGSEYTMTFHKISEAAMNEFDLDEELFINQKFEVTYSMETVLSKDDDGFDQEDDIYTITHLKAL